MCFLIVKSPEVGWKKETGTCSFVLYSPMCLLKGVNLLYHNIAETNFGLSAKDTIHNSCIVCGNKCEWLRNILHQIKTRLCYGGK